MLRNGEQEGLNIMEGLMNNDALLTMGKIIESKVKKDSKDMSKVYM